MQAELDGRRVNTAPPTVYYWPDFIDVAEEKMLLKNVYDAPKPKWTQLSNRRLQNWGGLPHQKGMVLESIPKWLGVYMQKISALGAFGGLEANHCLVNEYLPGQGIMPHEDGNLFFPTVSTITLGSHAVLDFYYHHSAADNFDPIDEADNQVQNQRKLSFQERHFASLLLEPRSLVVIRDDMYTTHLHGIAERTTDVITEKVANISSCEAAVGDTLAREARVSLTIRHVPRVLNVKLRI